MNSPQGQHLFGVPVFQVVLESFPDNKDAIVRAISKYRQASPGVAQSNIGGWHSASDLHKSSDSAFRTLFQEIHRIAAGCVSRAQTGKRPIDLLIASAWVNVNPPGSWNAPHNHLPCEWSGVFYVEVPACAGDDTNINQAGELALINPVQTSRYAGSSASVTIRAQEGLIVLFPSHLLHMVTPNMSTSERISIAFNYVVRPSRQQPAES